MYGKVVKQSFSPKPTDEVKKVYELLKPISRLPGFVFIKVKSSHRYNIIFSNSVIYVENGKGLAETVFNFLKNEGREAYLRPDKEILYRYVDMDRRVFFVKNLGFGSTLAESVRCTDAYIGKIAGRYIEGLQLFLSARQ